MSVSGTGTLLKYKHVFEQGKKISKEVILKKKKRKEGKNTFQL